MPGKVILDHITIRSPETSQEYFDYYSFRWQMLRQPWGVEKGSEQDELEDDAFHRIALHHDDIIACGRLHFSEPATAQIRYMAVSEDFQQQGIGKLILLSLEDIAKKNQANKLILNARESAIGFYEKQGYKIITETHTLFNTIKHFKMERCI